MNMEHFSTISAKSNEIFTKHWKIDYLPQKSVRVADENATAFVDTSSTGTVLVGNSSSAFVHHFQITKQGNQALNGPVLYSIWRID